MFCRTCGAELTEEQAVCIKCGVPKGKGKGFCQNCGKEVNPEAVFCVHCGVSLEVPAEAIVQNGEPANYLNGKDKVAMALLCFFLGGIGIHNFMLGESKKGIVKIVTSFLCGIGGILALIDFVKILMGSYIVDPEKYI